MKLLSVDMLQLFWLLPFVIGLFVYAGYARRHALAKFVEAVRQGNVLRGVSETRRNVKYLMLVLAFALIIFALSRPAWNPVQQNVSRRGRDVIFVLDVSRSMLAADLNPNRLERAKLAINDCIEVLQGDRVGLVLFAGTAAVRCPLTVDYGFFKLALSDADPTSVGRGGTKIGDALRLVMKDVLDGQEKKYKDVILITDGEDQDSFAVQAAESLGREGVRLITIGLGTEGEGTTIMVSDEDGNRSFIQNKGQLVRSHLDSDTLRKMAMATPGGRYLPVATGNFDLGNIYRSLIADSEKRIIEDETVVKYEEKYQSFLLVGVLLIILEAFIGIRSRQ